MEKENILISACLLGQMCRYDGKSQEIKKLHKLLDYYNLVPFCPEVSGGLKIPRDPSEIKGDKVISIKGKDVTKNFNLGAFTALNICKNLNIKLAILKEESPSCGVNKIHDGSFNNNIISGSGITTKRLISEGIKVINENDALKLLDRLENEK